MYKLQYNHITTIQSNLFLLFCVAIISTVPLYAQSIPEGVYRIISACNSDYVIDLNGSIIKDGNNIHIWDNNETDAQKWKVTHEGDAIVIRSVINTDYVIDLYGSVAINGRNIHLWKYNGTDAQRWIPEYKNGYYILHSKVDQNYTIDLSGSNTQRGVNIHCWEANGTNAQLWKFQLLDKSAPPMLSFVEGTLSFDDPAHNNCIDANENCFIKFKIKNNGKGAAINCEARVKLSGTTSGISVQAVKLPSIAAGQTYDIKIPVSSDANTQEGNVKMSVQVYEPNGWGVAPFDIEVSTKAFVSPLVQIVDYNITSPSGKVRRMEPFTIAYTAQNIKYGDAEDVKLKIIIPQNVIIMEGGADLSFPLIKSGERKSAQIVLAVNNNYEGSNIPIAIDIKEKYGKYAENKQLNIELVQPASPITNIIVKEEKETFRIVSSKDMALVIAGTPRIGMLSNTSVSILRPDWYNKYYNPQNIKAPFPYAVIQLELKGNKEAIDLAKQRLSLTLGGKHIVAEKDTKDTNTIWFLVHCRNEYIDLDCGDGCEPINIWKERLEPNKVYKGNVSVSVP